MQRQTHSEASRIEEELTADGIRIHKRFIVHTYAWSTKRLLTGIAENWINSGEDLASGGDGGEDQGWELCHCVVDEALTQCRAQRESCQGPNEFLKRTRTCQTKKTATSMGGFVVDRRSDEPHLSNEDGLRQFKGGNCIPGQLGYFGQSI
jgi:hypothetical protein